MLFLRTVSSRLNRSKTLSILGLQVIYKSAHSTLCSQIQDCPEQEPKNLASCAGWGAFLGLRHCEFLLGPTRAADLFIRKTVKLFCLMHFPPNWCVHLVFTSSGDGCPAAFCAQLFSATSNARFGLPFLLVRLQMCRVCALGQLEARNIRISDCCL